MDTKIYIPLRSNTTWFSDQEAVGRFERLLKIHVALYDTVILEDGIFRLTTDGGAQGWASIIPPTCTDSDRTKLEFFEKGGNFGLAVDNQVFLHGKIAYACNADFKPIIYRAGLLDATYFEWKSCDLRSDVKRETETAAEHDFCDPAVSKVLPGDKFLKKEILKGFYRDAVLATVLRVPFAVDHHLSTYLNLKRAKDFASYTPSVPLVLLDHWLELNLPDFANYSWQEIHELHEAPHGNDFRRMIERLTLEVNDALPQHPTYEDLRNLVERAFTQELLNEIRARRASLPGAGVNLLLNLVPYGTVLSSIKDASSLARDSTSWISLL